MNRARALGNFSCLVGNFVFLPVLSRGRNDELQRGSAGGMAKKTKASEAPHLRIRLDTSLLERLEKSRAKAGRTLTGEITDRLEASFKREDMQAYIDATAQAISERLIAATAEREKLSRKSL